MRQSAGGAIKEVREVPAVRLFHMEEAASGRASAAAGRCLACHLGPGTAHVVKLGAVGFKERLEQGGSSRQFSGQHRPFRGGPSEPFFFLPSP